MKPWFETRVAQRIFPAVVPPGIKECQHYFDKNVALKNSSVSNIILVYIYITNHLTQGIVKGLPFQSENG